MILRMKRHIPGEPCINGHLAKRSPTTGECTACRSAAATRWRINNPEQYKLNKIADSVRRREKACWASPAQRARQQRYDRKRRGVPEATRPTPEHCECCGSKLLGGKYTHLDPCHKTGKFRGWLCNRCNRGLGYFDDCIEGLERAISYLKRSAS